MAFWTSRIRLRTRNGTDEVMPFCGVRTTADSRPKNPSAAGVPFTASKKPRMSLAMPWPSSWICSILSSPPSM
jgi:hypothetical protein